MIKRIIIISSIILLLLIIAACVVIYKQLFSPSGIDIDKNKYPVKGIDISNYQSEIDWDTVKGQKIDFVFIKATEGLTYEDPSFNKNFADCKKTNIPTGAYHFFRFDKDGKGQAANFLRAVNISLLDLPPVIDVEERSIFKTQKSDSEIKKEIKAFIDAIQLVYAQKVIIYTNESCYNRFIRNDFSENPIWICSFDNNPVLSDKREWLFWQHAHNGKLEGIDGYVDLDTYNGDESEWKEYLGK
jgi:lysozyme